MYMADFGAINHDYNDNVSLTPHAQSQQAKELRPISCLMYATQGLYIGLYLKWLTEVV